MTDLRRVPKPPIRNDVQANDLQAAGMDWTEVLAVEAENPRARLVAGLLASPAYGNTAARVQALLGQGGYRATFFNCRRKPGSGNGRGGKSGA